MRYRSLNPTTEEELRSFALHADAEVERRIAAAVAAFEEWRRRAPGDRAGILARVADLLEGRAGELSRLMAIEMGKPLVQGLAEARKCAWGCRHFAARAEALLAPEARESDGSAAFVRPEPLGPILAIMPWNYPFWQFFRFAAPALAAGNTVLLKHAPSTPQCALEIERLMLDGGLPEGVVQNLFLSDPQVARVIADDRVRGVTLTGSTRAGREVAQHAGRHLKRIVLELGGSDAFLVFDDADLEVAARAAAEARCQNSGQSCIAGKRFFVQRPCFEEFRERFVASMASRVVGDPLVVGTEIGPLGRADLRDRLAEQVRRSLLAGAEALCGGAPLEGRGYFYPPTVLAGVPAGAPAAEEELFGPVAMLAPFDTEREAVHLANATRYGLGASVWTRERERAGRLVGEIQAGSVFVNGLVKSDPRLPFGGVKDSGFGRELGREGLLEFTNLKTAWIA